MLRSIGSVQGSIPACAGEPLGCKLLNYFRPAMPPPYYGTQHVRTPILRCQTAASLRSEIQVDGIALVTESCNSANLFSRGGIA